MSTMVGVDKDSWLNSESDNNLFRLLLELRGDCFLGLSDDLGKRHIRGDAFKGDIDGGQRTIVPIEADK